MKKFCRVCGVAKELDQYYKSPKHLLGCRNECKWCHNMKQRDYDHDRYWRNKKIITNNI